MRGAGLAELHHQLTEILFLVRTGHEVLEGGTELLYRLLHPTLATEERTVSGTQQERREESAERLQRICEEDEVNHEDEIFEAEILEEELESAVEGREIITEEERLVLAQERRQSQRLLRELRTVLVGRQQEWRDREDRARARVRQSKQGQQECEKREEQKVATSQVDVETVTVATVVPAGSEENTRNMVSDITHEAIDTDEENESSEGSTGSNSGGRAPLPHFGLFPRARRPPGRRKPSQKGGFRGEVVEEEEGDEMDERDDGDKMAAGQTVTDRSGMVRTLNTAPVGFDSSLASQAVARCFLLRRGQEGQGEEQFGDSD